jgi:hypothetical protein
VNQRSGSPKTQPDEVETRQVWRRRGLGACEPPGDKFTERAKLLKVHEADSNRSGASAIACSTLD